MPLTVGMIMLAVSVFVGYLGFVARRQRFPQLYRDRRRHDIRNYGILTLFATFLFTVLALQSISFYSPIWFSVGAIAILASSITWSAVQAILRALKRPKFN